MRRLLLKGLLALSMALAGCASPSQPGDLAHHDASAGLDREDFRRAFALPPPVAMANEAPIPPIAPVLQPPPAAVPSANRVISVHTDGAMPVGELLLSIARTAEVDIDLEPGITGSIIMSARDRPFLELVERIAQRAGLRWSLEGGYLKVERDTPLLRSYRVDYLNLVRGTESSVGTTASVSSSAGTGDSANGSRSEVKGSSAADFWTELEAVLTQILGDAAPAPEPATAAPTPTAAAAPRPPVSLPLPVPLPAGAPTAAIGALLTGAGAAGLGGGEASAMAPPAAASAEAAPVPPAGQAAAPTGAQRPARSPAQGRFTINRQAGIVSVFANERQHRQVNDYLRRLKRVVASQVLIEARVLEVNLVEEFESGVNWRSLFGGALEFGTSFGRIVAEPPFTAPTGLNPVSEGTATLAIANSDISTIAQFVEKFGTVRTLSSPRITVLHNQTAVLKVAENQVFFRLQYQTQQSQQGGVSTTTVSSELNTVPVGVIITVQPSIEQDSDRVALAIRPTVTRVVDRVADPAVAIASSNRVESLVPVVAVQELDSVVTMGSGQVLVMGGLMQNDISNTDTGVPRASKLPLIGGLFKARSESSRKSELIVFLKATIVRASNVDEADVRLNDMFPESRRALGL